MLPIADLVIDVYSMSKDARPTPSSTLSDRHGEPREASRSGQAGAGDLDLGGDEAGVVGVLALVGQEAGRAALEQGRAVGTAEHAGVHAEAVGRRDLLDHAAALLHQHAALAEGVGAPDAALGVEAAAVGRHAGEVGPDPPMGERAVVLDGERRVAVAHRLAHDERRAVRRDHRAVREGQVLGRQRHRAVEVHPHEVGGGRLAAGHEVEAGVADVGAALGVDDHVVGEAAAVLAEGRDRGHGAVGAPGAGASGPSATPRAGRRRASSRGPTAAARRASSSRTSPPSGSNDSTSLR